MSNYRLDSMAKSLTAFVFAELGDLYTYPGYAEHKRIREAIEGHARAFLEAAQQ